jgi:molecular chaperone DnaK
VQKTDERDTLGFISVNVDPKAQPLRERLILDVAIDENLILNVTAQSTVMGDSDRAEFHELEFGLAIDAVGDDRLSEGDGDDLDSADNFEPGSVLLRANVSHRETDQSAIPGELMRELNPHYFDLRNRPPAVQDYEKLVYQPCSACGAGPVRMRAITVGSDDWSAGEWRAPWVNATLRRRSQHPSLCIGEWVAG